MIRDQWCFSNYVQIKGERGARRGADRPSAAALFKKKNNLRGNSRIFVFTNASFTYALARTELGKKAFVFSPCLAWNMLQNHLKLVLDRVHFFGYF